MNDQILRDMQALTAAMRRLSSDIAAHIAADTASAGGTVGMQMACGVHGDSPLFPSEAQADAWMDGHVGCESDDQIDARARRKQEIKP